MIFESRLRAALRRLRQTASSPMPMAEQRRIDRVRISLSRAAVELPWQSRQALLSYIDDLDAMRPVRDAFRAAGTSQPVVLTLEQEGELREEIEFWAKQGADGYEGLPEGIYELRNALTDNGHDASPAA